MGSLERVRGAGHDLIHAARRDPRAEQLSAQLDRVTARDAIADRERRDRRLQARPERAARNLAGQLPRPLLAAVRTTDTLALMLDHHGRDPGQLLDLMTRRRADHDPLAPAEHVPAPAHRRPALHNLIHRDGRQQLPTLALMTRLRALRAR